MNGDSKLGGGLGPLLEARSVAVIGASARPGSAGEQMVHQLVRGGFAGPVHPVNPRYEEILGLPCLPAISDVPEPVDLVLLGVPNAVLEEQLLAAADAGARSAVIFASALEGGSGDGPPMTDRLAAIARRAGMTICGANCMGFVNLERNLRALAFHEREDLEPGGVSLVSHSGSVFTALLHNRRGIRFNVAVSSGQELTTSVADYLAYAVTLDSTRVVGLFIETVRDPAGFREALDLAAAGDVPVVALKVGRAGAARELVAAHSGALAGDDGAYEALFEAHGVLRVDTLEEMGDTLELLSPGRRAGPGGLAAICDSGGERAHLVDVAQDVGVRFAEISPGTAVRIAEHLDPGLPAVNPLDAWGTGRDYEEEFRKLMHILLDDPDTAALAFAVDLAGEDLEPGYTRTALRVWGERDAPFAVLASLSTSIDPDRARELREGGIPVLEGTATGLAAFGHLLTYRDHRELPAPAPADPVAAEVRLRWRDRLERPEPWTETEALRLVADYGLSVARSAEARTEEEALASAAALGWPVALKTAEAGHKTDVGGVHLRIGDPRALSEAYRDLAERLGPAVTVAEMVPPGVELAFGMVRDAQFGPVVLVGAGGVLTELLGDRRTGLPPLDEPRARRMVDGLEVRPVLDGARGGPAADVGSVTRALARLSLLAEDLGDLILAIDVNPVISGPEGCVAVDALVIPAVRGSPDAPPGR